MSRGPAEQIVVIERSPNPFRVDVSVLWDYWELLYFLVWRDFKIRYKQTFIGIGWVVLQPLFTMMMFTAVFSGIAKIPSDGIPYPVFAFAGLLPWTYFANALTRSGNSLVGNSNLITKVYFPRLLIPLAAVMTPLLDCVISLVVLGALMAWFQIAPSWAIVTLPAFLFACTLTAFAVSAWLSALCVRYRDVGLVIPFLVQIWLFASPVAYPASLVPERWRFLYDLNPMVGVIEGIRWSLVGGHPPNLAMIGVSTTVVLTALYGGLVFFRRMELVFADVI